MIRLRLPRLAWRLLELLLGVAIVAAVVPIMLAFIAAIGGALSEMPSQWSR